MHKALFSSLLAVLLLVGCSPKEQQSSPAPSAESEITGYTLLDVKTAVLTADATLTDCYSYTLKNGYGTTDANDSQFHQWITLDLEHELSLGDIVAVLGEDDGISRVVIPYGDLPWLYGFIPTELLSTEQTDIEAGNQAILEDCDAYDSPNGTPLPLESARVKIIDREGEWAKVQEYGTGAEPYWVCAADLTFDFDATLPDRPQ